MNELDLLRAIASQSRYVLARYPFDTDEQMQPRWRQLALLLGSWHGKHPTGQ